MAQDLAINNARIIDGTGRVIERGSILIANGLIVAIEESEQEARLAIDARGMTVMPGLINTHVHLVTGPSPDSYGCNDVIDYLDETLLDFLRRGFTTILSTGDPLRDILALRERMADGLIQGPELLIVGPAFGAPNHPGGTREGFCGTQIALLDEATARAEVRRLAAVGIDGIKVIYDSAWPPQPNDLVLAALVDEAHAHNLPVMAHVQTVEDAAQATRLGVDQLVHFPHIGPITEQLLEELRRESVPISSTVHLQAPINGADGRKLNHGDREYASERLDDAEMHLLDLLDDVRTFWDAGLLIAFGTDSYRGQSRQQNPKAHEIETLSRTLSPSEVVATLTRNGAAYLGLSDQIGTLELGKLADIIILDGDPHIDLSQLANVKVVIKGGEVVIDDR